MPGDAGFFGPSRPLRECCALLKFGASECGHRGVAAPGSDLLESATSGKTLSTATRQLMEHPAGVYRLGVPATPALDRRAAPRAPDRVEELANSLTHGVGLVLSLAGLYALVVITGRSGSSEQAIGCVTYGGSLVLLYAASTLYHGWRDDATKRFLLVLDHIGIYTLIAGSYTPLALIPLHGPRGWALLVLAWGSALVGSVAKVLRFDRLHEDSPLAYVAMSWMGLAVFGQILATLSRGEVLWLLGGGGFYMVGLFFFITDDRRFHHTIWHLFVLAGSICHYRAVIGYVMPIPA